MTQIHLMKTILNLLVAASLALSAGAKEIKLLNVSYDPTRELYTEFNAAFAKYWLAKTGDSVVVSQSHGGSGKQAQSVMAEATAQRQRALHLDHCFPGPQRQPEKHQGLE